MKSIFGNIRSFALNFFATNELVYTKICIRICMYIYIHICNHENNVSSRLSPQWLCSNSRTDVRYLGTWCTTYVIYDVYCFPETTLKNFDRRLSDLVGRSLVIVISEGLECMLQVFVKSLSKVLLLYVVVKENWKIWFFKHVETRS